MERQAVTVFELTAKNPGEQFGYPDRQFAHPQLVEKLNLARMVTIPIFNFGNQNYVRLVVSVFPKDANFRVDEEREARYYWMASVVTLVADWVLGLRPPEKVCYIPARDGGSSVRV